MAQIKTANYNMKPGSDTKFREHVVRAARRFEMENENLDRRIMMTVVDTHLIDFMWRVWRQSRPTGPLPIQDAFRAVMLDFVNKVIEGTDLPHTPPPSDVVPS